MKRPPPPPAPPTDAHPLRNLILRRIAVDGPMGVAEFMALCLGHPRYGYYMTRDPLGARGDFTTAPEISQMFGELVGAWLADLWLRAGSPDPVILAELGPGRGTLMADALRATAQVPGFHAAIRLHLVETSPVLRRRQAESLVQYAPFWHDTLNTLPEGMPLLLVANEFFDALPVRQFLRGDHGWGERRIGLGAADTLAWTLDPRPGAALVPPVLHDAATGSIVEIAPMATAVTMEIAARLAISGGGALIIDYGYSGPAVGDTLQAVRAHGFVDVLTNPGEADLTAHVDFSALAEAATNAGVQPFGPVTQGQWLRHLGLAARVAALSAAAPDKAEALHIAASRLTDDGRGAARRGGMGQLFKALAVTGKGWPEPAGFGPDDTTNAPGAETKP